MRLCAKRLFEELKARQAVPRRVVSPDAVLNRAFDAQRKYLDDPHKRIAKQCSRRAGKTTGDALKALSVALMFPGATIPVVELSRTSKASAEFQDALEAAARQTGIELSPNRAELSYTLPNGASIQVASGADNREWDKLRGGKYPLVIIDEAQGYRPSVLKYGVEEVIEPALMDFDGTLVLSGTPGAALVGLFYDITGNGAPGWSVHKWSVLDNPHIPHAKRWLKDLRERRKWTVTHPVYLREYGNQWVKSLDQLCYPYEASKNSALELPAKSFNYVLAMDFGFVDSTAFVLWAYSFEDPVAYCVKSYKRAGLTPSSVVEEIRRLQAQYPIYRMVGDTGGLGKSYVEEARERHGIHIEAADKRDKRAAIDLMAGDMVDGLVKWLPGNDAYVEEMSILQWDELRKMPDERYEDHLCDGGVYGYKKLYHWLGRNKEPERKKSLAEQADEQFEQMVEERAYA